MTAWNMLNVVLWSVQGLLACFFFAVGVPKVIGHGVDRWTGFADLPRPLQIFIGATEVLGAVGLVLPMATGLLPWLAPLAAGGLAIIVVMATGFHVRADERLPALEASLLAGIATTVAIGRWELVASRFAAAPWVLITTLGMLVPSAIICIIVVWQRAGNSGRHGAELLTPSR